MECKDVVMSEPQTTRRGKRRRRKGGFMAVRGKYKIPKDVALLGQNKRATLKFHSSGQLNPVAVGLPAYQVYRAGDLYDPDFTGAGAQPRGFDQMMAMFSRFTVLSSKINITFMQGASQDVSVIVGVALLPTSTSPSTLTDLLEGRNVSYKALNWRGGDPKVVSKNFNSSQYFSLPNPLDEDDLEGTSAASPTQNAFYHCFVCTTYSTDGAPLDYSAVIEYDSVFTEPVEPSQS